MGKSASFRLRFCQNGDSNRQNDSNIILIPRWELMRISSSDKPIYFTQPKSIDAGIHLSLSENGQTDDHDFPHAILGYAPFLGPTGRFYFSWIHRD